MPRRWWRGASSAAGTLAIPLGRFGCRGIDRLCSPERYEQGLVIVLPGIQGKSHVESSVARGLADAGVELAVEVFDWTTGYWMLFPYHLRRLTRNRRIAAVLAERVCEYRRRYPDRPVHIIGHSGGAGLALLAVEALPADEKVMSLILLAPAVSPNYDLTEALVHVERGVWNFCSRFDLFFLGFGTTLLGTVDGRHVLSAGARGFKMATTSGGEDENGQRLRQQPFVAKMLRSWNYGGHFGCTNRVFVAEWLAPLLRGGCDRG